MERFFIIEPERLYFMDIIGRKYDETSPKSGKNDHFLTLVKNSIKNGKAIV